MLESCLCDAGYTSVKLGSRHCVRLYPPSILLSVSPDLLQGLDDYCPYLLRLR
jgi:hypothetical protein